VLTAARASRDARSPLVLGVLTTAMALATLPATAVGVLAPFLLVDLGITRAGIGSLVALSAGVAGVLSPLAGRLVDRVGDRTALLLVVGIGIVGLAAMAGAPSWPVMAVALAVSGVCRAGSNPATNRVIATRAPRGQRGWITGVKQSGETLAVVVGAGLLPALALALGWRGALLALTVATLPAIWATLRGLDAAPPRPAVEGPRARAHVRPAVYCLMAYSFAMGASGGCVSAYLPLYAHESGGLGVAAAGGVMVLAGVVATVCRIAWGRVAEVAPSTAGTLRHLAELALLGTIVLLLAPHIGPAAMWVGAALWGASGLGFGSVCMLAVMEESDDASTGKGTGLVVFSFAIGSTLTPPLFGWLTDSTGSYLSGFVLVAAWYVVAAGVMLSTRTRFGRQF
jgi:predicted MFS family arabinose efflux permease